MKKIVSVLFVFILVSMASSIVHALLTANFFESGSMMMNDAWGRTTLLEAYLAFTVFYVWVFYKEGLGGKIAWFLLIMGIGNVAIASYVLIQIAKMDKGDSWAKLLLNDRDYKSLAR
ncbi:DUF1475 family protein [Candidatus Uabimicrobium amorphum]|uniref:DUF1475 domain-containing protein n=1 Tax=Uabimicrobium amorphum TaxID=2596890 RepID=A0A5S9IMG1_UABAM|nr:DUF1475 family protein [Candidatus Uabimicrobium amorphum]BBM83265.1 hypothetical protein UABAM_01616 [Candidatus Uabimicrobium amorphum]